MLKEQKANTDIYLAVEFLANRLSMKHSIYFNGGGRCTIILAGRMPPMFQFSEDVLADTIKRVIKILEATLKHTVLSEKAKQGLKEDISVLQKLVLG